MFAFGYINHSLPNHLLHSNKYGIFVQTVYQLHSYAGKCSSKYLNLIFFSLYLVLISLKVLFWRFHVYLLSNYVNRLLYAFYSHLRGLQICYLFALVNT